MKTLHRQQGIAIVTAVAIAAMVAAIASFMAFRENLWLRQVENQHDLTQARLVAMAALNFCKYSLQDDARDNKGGADSVQRPWMIPVANLPVEQGHAGGQISDAQGRFNINNLVNNGIQSDADVTTFRRLLYNASLSPDLAPYVVQWISNGDTGRSQGADPDRDYLSMDPPRRAASRPMLNIEELAQVRGFDDVAVQKLAPYLDALPVNTQVNVNFAQAPVLMALIPGLEQGAANVLAARAKTEPYNNIEDFRKALPADVAAKMPSTGLTVQTQFFYADVDARFGNVSLSYRALLQRTDDKIPVVIWMHRH